MKEIFVGFQCSLCRAEYGPDDVTYTCPDDGGNLDVVLDYESILSEHKPEDLFKSNENSLWRYLSLLPVDDPGGGGTPLHKAGWTPIYSTPRLANRLGIKHLWVKDESSNPTASFKDRASAVVIARAGEIGADVVVTASTGNAGAALAGMAAAVNFQSMIFAPRTAPPAKIAQLLIYNSKVILVDGSYDDAFDLTVQASNVYGWYCRNTGYNPFTAEGKKTAAFEIWEWYMRHLEVSFPFPSIFIPVGDGNIISGMHKGFKDLAALGWLESLPRIFGVQAEGSAAIARTFLAGAENISPVSSDTIADSISVDLPRDGVRALRAARETHGGYIVVSDEEILYAMAELGKSGIFAEPAGAASYAGLVKAVRKGAVKSDDPILVLNTGNGLKDVSAAMQAVPEAPIIEPTLEAIEKIIDQSSGY
jgi:threonine synthase